MNDSYWDLPKDQRWMRDGDSPERIGGRDTDLTQIGYSLQSTIKAMYPMNSIPQHVVDALVQLQATLGLAEDEIDIVIDLVSKDIASYNEVR